MSITAKVGDLFAVPLTPTSWGAGIVAGKWKSELYLVLFKEQFDNPHSISGVDIASLTPVLASSSLDAKIWHGHWPVVREHVDVSALRQPLYKVEEPVGMVAESFDRSFRQILDSDVAQRLGYRKGVAPVRLENALKALHGHGAWDPIFDELKYQAVLQSNEVWSTLRKG